jgi:DNA relaxase NicK
MRFDWYQATIHESRERVMAVIELDDPRAETWGYERGRHGYEHCAVATQEAHRLLSVSWGRYHQGCHLQATGETAHQVAMRVRYHWPYHTVTRADVCEDFDSPGAFDLLSKLALRFADKFGIKVRHYGDWHRGVDGRTLYLGSMKSTVQVRIYEKGIERAAAGVSGASRDWVRVELSVRPAKHGKAVASTLEPVAMWGASRWTREFGECMASVPIDRAHLGTMYAPSDLERSYRAMIAQYGKTLRALERECGGWEALCATIRDDLEVALPKRTDTPQTRIEQWLSGDGAEPHTGTEELAVAAALRVRTDRSGD